MSTQDSEPDSYDYYVDDSLKDGTTLNQFRLNDSPPSSCASVTSSGQPVMLVDPYTLETPTFHDLPVETTTKSTVSGSISDNSPQITSETSDEQNEDTTTTASTEEEVADEPGISQNFLLKVIMVKCTYKNNCMETQPLDQESLTVDGLIDSRVVQDRNFTLLEGTNVAVFGCFKVGTVGPSSYHEDRGCRYMAELLADDNFMTIYTKNVLQQGRQVVCWLSTAGNETEDEGPNPAKRLKRHNQQETERPPLPATTIDELEALDEYCDTIETFNQMKLEITQRLGAITEPSKAMIKVLNEVVMTSGVRICYSRLGKTSGKRSFQEEDTQIFSVVKELFCEKYQLNGDEINKLLEDKFKANETQKELRFERELLRKRQMPFV